MAWRQLLDLASEPYRGAGRFAWHFARGKLGMDPVFRHLLRHGLIAPGARVLDIGCGQGLLASLLRACGRGEVAHRWPAGWAPAPAGARVTGIELMPRDVERARAALGEGGDARFVCGDMRRVDFPACDAVVILDVLHYVTHAEQNEVLRRVRDALAPGGRLLLRVGDAGARRGFAISQWVDRLVTRVRGHTVPPTYGRTLPEWIEQLRALGLRVEPRPMSEGTPFANVLLVAQREEAARP
nr:class I SAM-dependent methyltransferase [Ramlibacter aurantiacus]